MPALEGKVEARGDLKPVLDDAYRKLVKHRSQMAAEPESSILADTDDTAGRKPKLSTKAMRQKEEADKAAKAQKRQENATKRTKPELSKAQCKERVKELFTQQVHWRRPDLINEVGNNNQKVLGACLDELCDKVTQKGLHYGDFKLKAGYT